MAQMKETVVQVLAPICGTVNVTEHCGETTFMIDKGDICDAVRELRDNPRTKFELLIDITAVDYFRRNHRFEVVYVLFSLDHNERICLKVPLEEYEEPHCPTVTDVYEAANWYERETYDMYGIIFNGHPDLRRFYMPEDFVAPETAEPLYPLRKDFPLMGIPGSLPMPEKNPQY
ncbi:MAG: NADH-quinone oxidoreductase subunit C [Candidatus Kapabacteria bacterium]|jgi:NADH-quinone oxidoreductase subunit C|nr:NADH-quinone oxidoreductase subunit C [Candidatus Kapabacteria bacterium]